MLNYRRYGTGPALVFLHGFVGGSGAYVPTMNHFRRHYDVVAADLPGFAALPEIPGATAGPPPPPATGSGGCSLHSPTADPDGASTGVLMSRLRTDGRGGR